MLEVHKKSNGFTLIELLVVIAIIGVLASVVLVSLSSAREKSRDAARKAALQEVAKALELYHLDNGTYSILGAGAGGNGNGWFSYVGGAYPKSVAQQLKDDGYLGGVVVDPSGAKLGNQSGRSGYMIIANDSNFTLWANLESPSTEDTATLNTCTFNNYDNYHSSYPATARMNYCISN